MDSLIYLVVHFHNFKIKIQLIFSTCCEKSDGLSHDELRAQNLTQNIIRETIKVAENEMDQDRIPTHSRVNGTLRIYMTCTFSRSRGVLSRRCSENMQQIYRRTPMPKCDLSDSCYKLLLF